MPRTTKKHRVSIVDDHKSFTDGFKLVLKQFDDIEFAGAHNRAEGFLDDYANNPSDLVFMDINLGDGMDGIEATREILKRNPDIIVIAVSMDDDDHTVQKMLKAGAKGFFPKVLSTEVLKDVFAKAWNGGIYLGAAVAENCTIESTEQQQDSTEASIASLTKKDFPESDLQIMELIAKGETDKEISVVIGETPKVVEYRKTKIYKKLGVKNVAEMITVAFRLKLIS